MNGYAGKFLFVDLTNQTITAEPITEEFASTYFGGYGFGAKVLYDRMPKGADPLGPDNIFGIVTGPATGTKSLYSGRYTVVHKSPVTGGWNDANSGGYIGPELKKAGFDGLFVSGKAEKPVYLWIHDNEAEIRDASHLKGVDCKEIIPLILEEVGEKRARVMAIGKPGENMSMISCPINDGHRAPGRGGTGAVMGSKNLKAIVIRGTQTIPIADEEKVIAINQKIAHATKTSELAIGFGEYGTGIGTGASALSGDSPVKNWGGSGIVDYSIDQAQNLASAALDRYKTKKFGCANCPMGCGAEYSVPDGPWPLEKIERPEYETAASFGSTLLNVDEHAMLKCNELCNRAGLDTISAGMTVAWAMECYENGVLSKEELDGIALNWGNGEAIVALTQKMADYEGVGKVLANGSQYAADYFKKGHEYLQTASGIELPMHDPRFAPGLARTYQFDPTPGRHVKGGRGLNQMMSTDPSKYISEGSGGEDVMMVCMMEMLNCGGFCMFSLYGAPPGFDKEMIDAIIGKERSAEEVSNTGKRIYTLRHAFNLREGLCPQNMTIADRAIGKPPLEGGPLEGISIDSEALKNNFFRSLGFDPDTGIPTDAFFEEVGGLDDIRDDLKP